MFLCCGDALFDLFALPEEQSGSIHLEGRVGGSPLNVAVGLVRMGCPTSYLAKNSKDMFGRRIEKYLADNGVGTGDLISSDRNSTLAMVETGPDGSARYVFYTEGTADRSIFDSELPSTLERDVGCLHVGSYTTATEPTSSSLLTLVKREAPERFIAYDPNIRPTIEDDLDLWRQRLTDFGSHADFIKASDEDLELLYPGQSPDKFAADRIGKGASLVFITRGEGGALGFSSDGRSARVEGIDVEVVDTVGAGDTFQAASLQFLAARDLLSDAASGVDLEAILSFATLAASITCTRRGADLPTLAEVEEKF